MKVGEEWVDLGVHFVETIPEGLDMIVGRRKAWKVFFLFSYAGGQEGRGRNREGGWW